MAPPRKWARWASADFEGPELDGVYECIRRLRVGGLTGQMVAKDFTRRRIAPLQQHSEPVWRYTGKEDRMRLCVDNLAREVLYPIMGILFATKEIPAPATHETKSLFNFTAESVEKHRRHLPSFGNDPLALKILHITRGFVKTNKVVHISYLTNRHEIHGQLWGKRNIRN